MIRKSLLSMMLLAIAYSQILGGIACCCFVRVVNEQIHELTNSFVSLEATCPVGEADSHSDEVVTGCPKCASHAKARAKVAEEERMENFCEREEGGEIIAPCLCCKFDSVGSETSEAPVLKTKTGGAEWMVARFAKPDNHHFDRVQRHIPPPLLLFGKHSWQSMACVWRN